MDDYDKSIFAKNLKRYMELNNEKPSDICQLLHVSKSTVSSWCTGQKEWVNVLDPVFDKMQQTISPSSPQSLPQ